MAKKLATRLETLEKRMAHPGAYSLVSEGVLCLDAYTGRLSEDDDFLASEVERVKNYLLENPSPQEYVSMDECCDEERLFSRVVQEAYEIIELEPVTGLVQLLELALRDGVPSISEEMRGKRPGIDYLPIPGFLIGAVLVRTLDETTLERIRAMNPKRLPWEETR